MKGHAITYLPEELAWVDAHKDWPRADLYVGFCARFGRTDIALTAFKGMCKRKGFMTGRTGHFHQGQVSHNKGKKGQHAPGSEKGWFKKGQVPHTYRGAGHERIDSKDGYVVLIVDEVNPWSGAKTRPVMKHRYLWEKVNGPVPDGHRLKCLDGDKTNTDPSNWTAIPYGMAPRLNGRFGRGYDSAPAEIKPAIMAVTKLEHAARERKKGAKHG